MVVSKSEATTVNLLDSTSNKKLSKMGILVFVLKAPEMLCRWWRRVELDVTKFMVMLSMSKDSNTLIIPTDEITFFP